MTMNSFYGFLPSLSGASATSNEGLTCNFAGFNPGRYGTTDYATSTGGSSNGGPVTSSHSFLGHHPNLPSSGATHGSGQYAGAANGTLVSEALHRMPPELNGYGDPSTHGHSSAAAASPWGVQHSAAASGTAGGATGSQHAQPQQSPTDFSGHSSPSMCNGDPVPIGTAPYPPTTSVPFYPWMGVVGKLLCKLF